MKIIEMTVVFVVSLPAEVEIDELEMTMNDLNKIKIRSGGDFKVIEKGFVVGYEVTERKEV